MDIRQQLHQETRQFWKTAKNTFLGPAEYYIKQKLFIEKHVFPLTKSTHHILDMGCGNGFFTRMFSPYCHSIIGLDISKSLICEAQQTINEDEIRNIRYILIDDLAYQAAHPFDMMLCMGVTSAIIDENEFLNLLNFMRDAIKPNGYLILKDMLRIDNGDELAHSFQHNITRCKARYLNLFNQYGFRLIEQEILLDISPFNFSMFVMQRSEQVTIYQLSFGCDFFVVR